MVDELAARRRARTDAAMAARLDAFVEAMRTPIEPPVYVCHPADEAAYRAALGLPPVVRRPILTPVCDIEDVFSQLRGVNSTPSTPWGE